LGDQVVRHGIEIAIRRGSIHQRRIQARHGTYSGRVQDCDTCCPSATCCWTPLGGPTRTSPVGTLFGPRVDALFALLKASLARRLGPITA
jgi:hypothetical protein